MPKRTYGESIEMRKEIYEDIHERYGPDGKNWSYEDIVIVISLMLGYLISESSTEMKNDAVEMVAIAMARGRKDD